MSLLFLGPGRYPSGEHERVSSGSNTTAHARDNCSTGPPRTSEETLIVMLSHVAARSPPCDFEAFDGLVESQTKVNQAMEQSVAGTYSDYQC